MRTFNGLQIFTNQLTNSGQLDLRYVRISGNNIPANIYLGNLTQDYAFYSNTNFNIINSFNVSYNDTFQQYTGYMPELIDKKLITVKNLSSNSTLTIKTYDINQVFDKADNIFYLSPLGAYSFLGINKINYSGWMSMNSTLGIN
jgi:hypothetical protein